MTVFRSLRFRNTTNAARENSAMLGDELMATQQSIFGQASLFGGVFTRSHAAVTSV
jgi:hypothetical protein